MNHPLLLKMAVIGGLLLVIYVVVGFMEFVHNVSDGSDEDEW